MPQIPEYTASQPGIAAPETGVEAFAQAGRRIGVFYHQEGQELGGAIRSAGEAAQKYLDHQEISHGAVAYAGLFNKFTQDWNDTAKGADPNDPLVATRWRAKVEPQLEDFANSFHTEAGQKWAESRVDALRMHLFEKTTADMATLAGNAVTVNNAKVTDTYANTVSTDPSALPAAMKHYDDSVSAQVDAAPNLTPDKASQVKEELRFRGMQQIVKAGIQSAIEKNPDAGMKMAQDPRFAPYINASEIKQFDTYARAMQRAAVVQEKQAQLYQKQLDEQAVHSASSKAFNDNVSYDPATNKVTIKPQFYGDMLDIVRRNPNAPNATSVAKTYIDWGQAQQRERQQPIVSDPTVKRQLLDGMFDPDNPTTKLKVLQAEGAEKLSSHDGTVMREMVSELEQTPLRGPVWKDTMSAVHTQLTYQIPGLPGKDAAGEQAYAGFVQRFIPEYLRESRAGTLPPNALDLKDPKSLISQIMAPFQRTPAEKMQSYMDQFGGLAPDTNLGKPTGVQAIDIPSGMSIADAVKQYGHGASVRVPGIPQPLKLP